MDDTDRRLGLLARLGGALAVSGFVDDLEDMIEQGSIMAHWIQTGEVLQMRNAAVEEVAERCLAKAREANKKPK